MSHRNTFKMTRGSRRTDANTVQFDRRIPREYGGRADGLPVVVSFPATPRAPARAVTVRISRGRLRYSLGTNDPATVAARLGIAASHFETVLETVRLGPAPLSQRQTEALAGEVYRLFIDEHGDNPATPDIWAAVKGYNRAVREGRDLASVPRLTVACVTDHPKIARAAFGNNLTISINALPVVTGNSRLEDRFGDLANYILGVHGLVIDHESRTRLLVRIEAATTHAAVTLKRAANNDYSPDLMAARYPALAASQTPAIAPPQTKKPTAPKVVGPTWVDVFDAWAAEHKAAEKQPATRPQNYSTWLKFAASVAPRSPAEVVKADLVAWLAQRREAGIKASTLRRSDLGNVRAIYRAAMRADLIAVDPTLTVTVPNISGSSTTAGRRRGYTDAEAKLILNAAAGETNPLCRWVPLMLAYSGARVSEVTYLRPCDVCDIDGVMCFNVTPDAGRHVKNGYSVRIVPIHKVVLDAGFLAFVASRAGHERLFFEPPVARRVKVVPPTLVRRDPKTGKAIPPPSPPKPSAIARDGKPGKPSTEKLRRFLRTIPGLVVGAAVGLDPNHAWRHRFKTKATDAEIDSRVQDAICGHRPATVGAGYGEVSVKAKAAALAKLA